MLDWLATQGPSTLFGAAFLYGVAELVKRKLNAAKILRDGKEGDAAEMASHAELLGSATNFNAQLLSANRELTARVDELETAMRKMQLENEEALRSVRADIEVIRADRTFHRRRGEHWHTVAMAALNAWRKATGITDTPPWWVEFPTREGDEE